MANIKDVGTRKKHGNKWHTMRHKGPMFHPPYKRLKKQSFKYKNKIIPLKAASEEVVVMYCRYIMRKNKIKKGLAVLKRNFFQDWREKYMDKKERKVITNFNLCNFDSIISHLKDLDEKKKIKRKRKLGLDEEKARKEQEAKRYRYVYIDGRKEQVNNIMVEPPSLYIGRGDNKKIGKIKPRLRPEDVTINCSEGCRPRPPPGAQWGAIFHDRTKLWLASYQDHITGKMKYIVPHATSRIKKQSEQQKFEKAVELSKKITRIQNRYRKDFKSDSSETQQLATATYLLDALALRVGAEKNCGEAECGVGCCTLRVEHVKLQRNKLQLKFLGKDSVPYENEHKVRPQVNDTLAKCLNRKQRKDLVFDKITAKSVNNYLDTMMPGLTSKVFRTYKATECYYRNVKEYSKHLNRRSSTDEKLIAHKKANLEVAKLLNHMKMAGNKNATKKVTKLEEKLKDESEHLKRLRQSGPKGNNRKSIAEYEHRVQLLKEKLHLEKANRKWALRTSLANYIDPRVVIKWANHVGLDTKKIYPSALADKFSWALKRKPTQ